MNDLDFDRELSHALRDSTDAASPGFTGRVLTGLGRRPQRRDLIARQLLAAATLLLVLTALPAVRRAIGPGGNRQEARIEQREELLREYRALQEELDQIRRIAREQQPGLYLGGDEDFDLIYDLATYPIEGGGGTTRPAALPDRG